MNILPNRILVIEDEPLIREMIINVCSVPDNRVFATDNIAEGERLLRRHGADVLILDRILPDGDGLQLCARIRGDREFGSLPIIILSGKSGTEEKVLGLDIGADDYLSKPFSSSELKSRVNALLRRSRKLAQSSYIRRRLRMQLPGL